MLLDCRAEPGTWPWVEAQGQVLKPTEGSDIPTGRIPELWEVPTQTKDPTDSANSCNGNVGHMHRRMCMKSIIFYYSTSTNLQLFRSTQCHSNSSLTLHKHGDKNDTLSVYS